MKNKILFTLIFLIMLSCKDHKKSEQKADDYAVDYKTKTITFQQNAKGLGAIKTTSIGQKGQFVSVIAPGHTIAVVTTNSNDEKKIIFENASMNEIYFNFAQSSVNRKNSEKNFERIKDMMNSQAATIKELRDAEKEWLNSKHIENEYENKLKTFGFDPDYLKKSKHQVALIVSDVPESQLIHVEHGEDVDIFFSSFPNEKITGKIVGIGDVIDSMTRTLKVTIQVSNKENRYKAGMYAKVEFGDVRTGSQSIPATSIFVWQGSSYIFTTNDNKTFSLMEITPIAYNKDSVGISQIIPNDMKIVSEGALLLKSIIFRN